MTWLISTLAAQTSARQIAIGDKTLIGLTVLRSLLVLRSLAAYGH